MKKIILIGGSPTAGKSYTARYLSAKFDMPWISTDGIRSQMRQIVRQEDYLNLFKFIDDSSEAAEEYLTKNSPDDIVRDQNEESIDVWKGVEAFIKTDYAWGSFIVEGVAILPEFVRLLMNSEDMPKDVHLRTFFLIDANVERVRNTIFTRGLWDDASEYPDSVKEREVEWVMKFNEFLIKECKKYDFPIVDVGDRKSYLENLQNIISKV